MVGADAETFARVKPLLEAMGTTIHHCGGVGAGMRTKLVNNYLAIVSCALTQKRWRCRSGSASRSTRRST